MNNEDTPALRKFQEFRSYPSRTGNTVQQNSLFQGFIGYFLGTGTKANQILYHKGQGEKKERDFIMQIILYFIWNSKFLRSIEKTQHSTLRTMKQAWCSTLITFFPYITSRSIANASVGRRNVTVREAVSNMHVVIEKPEGHKISPPHINLQSVSFYWLCQT